MKFCSECARPIATRVPPGDTLPRYVCDHCGRIFYRNPRLVVGTVPRWEDKVLLCKRSIEPRFGYWTLPSGFLENGETVEQGALRESREEAEADLELVRLFSVFSLPHVNQVYMLFLADLRNPDARPGEETLETRLFAGDEIPWKRLAFRAVEFTLRRFVDEGAEEPQVHFGSYRHSGSPAWIEAEED